MITKTSSKCHLPLIFEARYDFRSWVHTVTGPRPGESTGRLQPITAMMSLFVWLRESLSTPQVERLFCRIASLAVLLHRSIAAPRSRPQLEYEHCSPSKRQSSGASGGSERGLQRKCFHNLSGGIRTAIGCLQRVVRPWACHTVFACPALLCSAGPRIGNRGKQIDS